MTQMTDTTREGAPEGGGPAFYLSDDGSQAMRAVGLTPPPGWREVTAEEFRAGVAAAREDAAGREPVVLDVAAAQKLADPLW